MTIKTIDTSDLTRLIRQRIGAEHRLDNWCRRTGSSIRSDAPPSQQEQHLREEVRAAGARLRRHVHGLPPVFRCAVVEYLAAQRPWGPDFTPRSPSGPPKRRKTPASRPTSTDVLEVEAELMAMRAEAARLRVRFGAPAGCP
jgi:hypothetical protein